MPDAIRILFDAPTTAGSRLQIAKLGTFKDARYGEFSITPGDITAWKKGLELLPGNRALIDFDHSAERPQPFRSTEAAGWITDVSLEDGVPMASVEWTPKGKQAILDKTFLFFSPTYGPHSDEAGVDHENVMIGGALTSRPFLNMPTVTLASEGHLAQALEQDPVQHVNALAAAGGLGKALDAAQGVLRATGLPSPDSRRQMKITPKIRKQLNVADTVNDETVTAMLKALGIADEADEKTIVTTLDGSLVKPTEPDSVKPETKTLEQLAADAGKRVLDAAAFDALTTGAAAGILAAQQLDDMTFKTHWDDAVTGLRRLENERDTYAHFYKLDREGTLKLLDTGPKLFNASAIGAGASAETPDAGDYMAVLDSKARKLMLEAKAPASDYAEYFKKALDLGADS